MPGRLVDAAALRLDDAVLDLIAHAETVAAADGVRLRHQLDLIGEGAAVDGDRHAFGERDRALPRRGSAISSRQKGTPMIGSTMVMLRSSCSRSLASWVAPRMLESVE